MKLKHLSMLYVLIPILAVLATLVEGFQPLPGGYGQEQYGFPLAWKSVELIPTCNGCPLPMSYNWSFFILDAAFYAAIGYAFVLLYTSHFWKQQNHLLNPGHHD